MTSNNFAVLLDLAAGGLILTAVLIVWRRDLLAIVRLLAWQGVALAAHPHAARSARRRPRSDRCRSRGALSARRGTAAAAGPRGRRRAASSPRVHPLVNTATSLLITAGLTLAAFAATQPLVDLQPAATTTAVPAATAVVLIALLVMVTRRHAISQAAGFLMLDNGIAATAFLLTAGVPLIVELGASLDVLFAVIVIGVLTGRLSRTFGGADLDALQELHD